MSESEGPIPEEAEEKRKLERLMPVLLVLLVLYGLTQYWALTNKPPQNVPLDNGPTAANDAQTTDASTLDATPGLADSQTDAEQEDATTAPETPSDTTVATPAPEDVGQTQPAPKDAGPPQPPPTPTVKKAPVQIPKAPPTPKTVATKASPAPKPAPKVKVSNEKKEKKPAKRIKPVMKPGRITVTGGYDADIVKNYIHKQLERLRWCHQMALQDDPEIQGRLVIRFAINSDGTTSKVKIRRSTVRNTDLKRCVQTTIDTWRFPQTADDSTAVVTYPFVFKITE